jgi:hypothetical protein
VGSIPITRSIFIGALDILSQAPMLASKGVTFAARSPPAAAGTSMCLVEQSIVASLDQRFAVAISDSGILPLAPSAAIEKRGFHSQFATFGGGHIPVPGGAVAK